MADGDQISLTPEEITALREENTRLQTERDAARNLAAEEQRRADGLYGQVVDGGRRLAESTVQGFSTQAQQADTTITTLTSEIAALRTQRIALLQEGKFDEEAEVNEKISEAVGRRQQAQQAKSYYTQQTEQARTQPADPVDRFFAANPQFSESEKAWIKRNPRYATDTAFMARVNAAHAEAIDLGYPQQSADYFAHLEKKGYVRADPAPRPATAQRPTASAAAPNAETDPDDSENPYSTAAIEPEEPIVQPQRPAPRAAPAAPVTRRSPTAPAAQRRVVAQLTEEQADAALKMSELAPIEIQNQGDAAILAWWADLNTGATAERLRREWREQ